MAREDIDYKEYSRLRDIAHKRVARMEKAGYDVNIQLPTVKQVRASENPYWFLREMQKFVEGATTLGAVRATGSPTLLAMMCVKGFTYKQDSKFESWYKVLDVYRYPNGAIDALLENVESGWTFMAHGIRFNEDKIYWSYSSGGYFKEVK